MGHNEDQHLINHYFKLINFFNMPILCIIFDSRNAGDITISIIDEKKVHNLFSQIKNI
jgi:hypothetical protein